MPIRVVRVDEDLHLDRRVVILDGEGRRIITSIEILSPLNKRSRGEREDFRAKQRELLAGGTNLVEIDLIRQGLWALPVPRNGLPDEFSSGTGVCVIRARDPAGRECYATPLDRRLPAIRVPLRETDADVALDLQDILDRTWSVGRFRFDYANADWPTLSEAEEAYARNLLREKGLLPSVELEG